MKAGALCGSKNIVVCIFRKSVFAKHVSEFSPQTDSRIKSKKSRICFVWVVLKLKGGHKSHVKEQNNALFLLQINK